MRIQLLIASVCTIFALCGISFGQDTTPINPTQSTQRQRQTQGTAEAAKPWENKKYELSSRILLQAGTNRGYLIVHVALAPDSYIYSMTQAGNIPPTKFTVAPTEQFRLLGQFSADRPAQITAMDPVFEQQVERHHQSVQFFAPIEIDPETDPGKLQAQISMDGQVCSKSGICLPLKNKMLSGLFAGYFNQNATHQAQASAKTNLR